MNKKGWLRILEAFLAIMLITGVLLVLYSRNLNTNRGGEIYNLQKSILDEVAEDDEMRT